MVQWVCSYWCLQRARSGSLQTPQHLWGTARCPVQETKTGWISRLKIKPPTNKQGNHGNMRDLWRHYPRNESQESPNLRKLHSFTKMSGEATVLRDSQRGLWPPRLPPPQFMDTSCLSSLVHLLFGWVPANHPHLPLEIHSQGVWMEHHKLVKNAYFILLSPAPIASDPQIPNNLMKSILLFLLFLSHASRGIEKS